LTKHQSKLSLKEQADAETRWMNSGLLEPAGRIERRGMRIADDVKDSTTVRARHRDALRNESAADPLAPLVGLDEQTIQLSASVRSRQDRREADDAPGQFRDHNLTGVDLLIGEGDRVRVCQQGRAVAGVVQRCAHLQGFQRRPFGPECQTK
jgi:hypothetical protein